MMAVKLLVKIAVMMMAAKLLVKIAVMMIEGVLD